MNVAYKLPCLYFFGWKTDETLPSRLLPQSFVFPHLVYLPGSPRLVTTLALQKLLYIYLLTPLLGLTTLSMPRLGPGSLPFTRLQLISALLRRGARVSREQYVPDRSACLMSACRCFDKCWKNMTGLWTKLQTIHDQESKCELFTTICLSEIAWAQNVVG